MKELTMVDESMSATQAISSPIFVERRGTGRSLKQRLKMIRTAVYQNINDYMDLENIKREELTPELLSILNAEDEAAIELKEAQAIARYVVAED